MNEPSHNLSTCPACGGRLFAGSNGALCPACLLLAAMADDSPKQPDLPEPAAPEDHGFSSIAERLGARIGRYKLLKQIGEGGFGIVWMAEQEEPVRRRVALKIIKPGMDSREVLARFEAERQALAMMDHPNIASIFDGGTTETGLPFFVMELVEGVPITTYCDANQLTTKDRLELFMEVCHAVQHAHQKGVIHRDLKPSNILVTVKDDRPVPKIIDFGIAKATQCALTDKTLFTRLNQWLGTPEYMSPEQAGLDGLDVNTRSDIYSLGVLLYELLTGRPPFDSERLRAVGHEAVMKVIREEEPPKPSTRLSTLVEEELNAVATRRGAEPAKLNRLIRGDLDWIVMKALEKDRQRRYETANGLADDIRRHLDNEVVLARPPSAVYRLKKAWRRHKVGFAAAAMVTAALVLGAVLSTWQALRATKAEALASQRLADPLPPVFENSLGMKFRPIPGTNAKLSIWETRLRDWRAFSSETKADASHPDEPVAGQPLQRIRDFCRWLTTRDQAARRIRPDEIYRLPTDREWSLAAGLTEPADAKPEDLSAKSGGSYPWGKLDPAPAGAGNYPDSALRERLPNAVVIPAYYDGHPFACAVGSFPPSPSGFFDLGGNLWELTLDEAGDKAIPRFRGGSWLAGSKDGAWKCLRAAHRATAAEVSPLEAGFRVVLARTDITREPTLAECARDGLLEKAAALLAKGAAVGEPDADGRTPLHLAAMGGHIELVKLLLKAGAALETVDDFGQTPLHCAAQAGSLPVVEALVAAGAKTRVRVRLTGQEPVHLAAVHPEILAFLAGHGADLRARDNSGDTPLHKAALGASLESVAWLAEQKVPLEARNTWGMTPLAWGAFGGGSEVCAQLIRLGASTNPPANENGVTLLAMAAMGANPEVVELLLRHGADPKPMIVGFCVTQDLATFQLKQQRGDKESVLGRLPLITRPAAPGDRAKVIRLLVQAGMPLEQTSHNGMTPLLSAAYEGNAEAVQTLLELGAKADAADAEKFTALHSAAEQGFVKVVELLLAKGLDLEAVHNRGRTALDCAALMGHREIVRRLLDAGAKPDGAPDAPSSPADTAARQGNAAILEMLLAHGADPNAVGKGGVTPLMGAASGPWVSQDGKITPLSELSRSAPHGTAEDYVRCVRLLLEKGANPQATADDGSTALHQAALFNQAEAARLLLAAKVSVHTRNKHLLTPLHSAAHGNAVAAAKVLLEHGATAAPELASYTPLHAAASAGALEMVALLLENGANPNQRDGLNSTPLHRAVISGNLPLVKLLASRGADPNCRDFGYSTPLHQAVFANKPELIRALIAASADPSLRNMEGMTPGDIAKHLRRDSCAAALTRGQTPANQAGALKEYLKRHPDWRQLQEQDCDPEDLKFARESFGAEFSPYYYEEDFNNDGRHDFAVILVNKAPPVEKKELADSHKWQYQLRVVVFNGLPGGGYDAVFAEDDQGPLACFLNKWKEPNSKLYFGVLETGQGFVIVPTESGYRIEHVKEPE